MAVDTDILVVGAGPIGLINAWGMKRLNPDLKIVIVEKYPQYQRSHVLRMEAKQLEAIMEATHSQQDPALAALLKQLRKDPHIRTNELQQIFTQLAEKSGIEIKTQQEVKEDEIQQTLEEKYPNVRLIIGADGTHSVVSRALFSEENQVKHEFDYVLQLRFDIDGEEKAPGISTSDFYQQMARKGLIANEYVGHFKDGKTPVTMQMMISKEAFLKLQTATSKNPLMFFADSALDDDQLKLPRELQSFITTYLSYKVRDLKKVGQEIVEDTVRISVNEAPATHAKQIVNQRGQARIVLKGDAALGLSYFKGLNAGLAASARFLATMFAPIQNKFQDTEETDRCLEKYQTWFLNDFAPKKVKEVGQYSFWKIRSVMQSVQVVRIFLNASMIDHVDDLGPAIRDYFDYFTKDPVLKDADESWDPFPHREYDLVKFGQWEYIPLKHTAKKVAKIFTDYFKPYKGKYQLVQDFKQPLMGIGNFFVGLAKIVVGIFTLDLWRVADGIFSLLRGTIELITTPLTWMIKPIIRGIATAIHGGYKKFEENTDVHTLLSQFKQYQIDETKDLLTDNKTIYNLRAICNDLHRKFDKQISRGQTTTVEVFEEYARYGAIREDNVFDKEKLINYFSLFAPAKAEEKRELDSPPTSKRLHGKNKILKK